MCCVVYVCAVLCVLCVCVHVVCVVCVHMLCMCVYVVYVCICCVCVCVVCRQRRQRRGHGHAVLFRACACVRVLAQQPVGKINGISTMRCCGHTCMCARAHSSASRVHWVVPCHMMWRPSTCINEFHTASSAPFSHSSAVGHHRLRYLSFST